MAGETQRTYAVKKLDAESKLQDEGTTLEKHSDKTTRESSEHFPGTGTEARTGSRGAKTEKLEKERDYTQQREAVIRPQQVGKIDFRSLQNRPKFATDRTWPSGKGSPQSPSGKSRSREKGKRSGKSERGNPQQLYRLSITNPRSNPTIGIAYPQQKVSPPKKLEASRGPVSGSYRFHVPSIPEREAELQQEDLNYSRFQEASSNLTSPSYTSQALGSAGRTSTHQHQPLSQQQQQPPGPMENNNAQPGSQLLFPDFQLRGSNTWQSPERTFNGANYGITSQKSTSLTEANKANAFAPLPFQYGYPLLEDSTSDTFPCEQNPQSQDFTDSSLGSVQVTHNSFPFPSGEGQEVVQNNTPFSNEQSEDRASYPHLPQPSQYMQAPQGAGSSMHCPRSLSEDSASSESSGPSSQQAEQGKSALSESTEAFGQADGRDAAITSGSTRSCHPKDTAVNQRTLVQGGVHHARNIAQGPSSQMHFPNKTFNSSPLNNIHMGSVPFDKSINNKVHSRLPHTWEGPNKTYTPVEQNTIPFPDMNDKFQFQNQPALDQRSNSSKSDRMPWQQIRLTSAMPSQNRIELSRQLSNQKLSYMVSPSDWQDDGKSHKDGSLKTPSSFQNNRTSEGFSNQRQETVKHSSGTISSFKVEMSHSQVCDSKNKPVYFGMNQSLPGASSRNYGYPPLQVPPIGLMMVSPYESPLPSPVHNPTSSSTCSSLSPASTSPVNLSSEESQMSKAGPPPPFYHQHQTKTQLPSDHLSTNPHHYQSDAPRNLTYGTDRSKEDMMSYMQNNIHPKTAMAGNKSYMDSFGVDHHPPPPPYSQHAHQLLANSLATANLDQLDVLLTCKQCDQNFNNVASFLAHKQYCAQHAFAHNDLKDISKVDDGRKFHADMSKAASSGSGVCQSVSMPRCPSELHLSLLGLNKNGELMSDSETKGDNKEDPMKLSLFSGPGNLPVSLPDLEMEDAKLDSLITEALNGLGYQSDNAEIDSSFIDAFVDDDLTAVKAASNRQSLKTKESMVFESKSKQAAGDDRSLTQGKYLYDSDDESPEIIKQHTESKLERMALNLEQDEKINRKKEAPHKNSRVASGEKSREQESKVKEARKLCKSEDENASTQRFLLSSKFSERCGVKSFQDSSLFRGSTPSQSSTANQTSPTPRTAVKESKRKRTGGGTWSKELIHKIVQQKNKLHKLHVKGTKNLQFSLVMERLTPTVQNPTFGEYDYVSDSDDECEPVKIASQGRLSQSSRCKYTYTKECKWRARSERDQAAWRHESKECFEVKKSEEVTLSPEKHGSHQRLRRRGSRSSTSSELSTSVSVSSDSINSPKSTERTDSDCEKKMEIRRKDSPEPKTYERSSPQKLCKESSTHLALTFTKSTKKCSTDKTIFTANKDHSEARKIHHSNGENADPVSSLHKVKGAIKNLEKYRGSHIASREKLESYSSRETSTAAISDRNITQRIDSMSPKVESTQSTSNDIKRLQLDSHSATINKETNFNKNERNSKEKSTHKRRDSEGHQATQSKSKLSDTSAFEKQNDSAYTVKEPISLVNDLVPKSTPLCSTLMDEVCLSPTEPQDPLVQKDTSHLMPYPLDQDQGLMKSPLSFDTSSMFGDLTVAGFDNGLYSDMPLQKEGFNSTESASDRKEEFVSSFSPFLEQRDWGLMVDVSPMLPDEIAQYKVNSEKSSEKKSDYNHVPLSLPDKIMDYSVNLNSCASEDELEIKRIVTELENQLQTTKLESPPLLAEEPPKQLQMSKFSPLRLGDESENEDPGLDMSCPVQTIDMSVASMPSEHFSEPGLPWSSPFQFELMGGPHSPTHNQPGVLEHLTEQEDDTQNMITNDLSNVDHHQLLQEDQKPECTSVEKRTLADTTEDILEQKMYAENLMKSLEVISDSIFKRESIIPEELNVTLPYSPQHGDIDCQAIDAAERGDHGEKEAITEMENILSPPNINEQKGDIEFVLNESQPALSDSTNLAADGKQHILSEPTENNDSGSETKVISVEEDITKDSNIIESAGCSNGKMDDSQVVEETCGNANGENADELLRNDTDIPEHTAIDGEEVAPAEGITGQSDSHHSPPAIPDPSLENNESMEDVIEKAWEEKSTDIHSNSDFSSSPADGLKAASSDSVTGESEIPAYMSKQDDQLGIAVTQSCSTPEIYSASQTVNMSMEVVTTNQPCSPLLMETYIDDANHCSPIQSTHSTEGESSLSTISQSGSILDSDACTVTSCKDTPKTEMVPACETIQKQDTEIPNVEDIEEHLPIHVLASPQTSSCKEDVDVEEGQTDPPTSPILSTSPHISMEKVLVQEDPCQPQSKCNDIVTSQGPIQNIQSPREENCDDQNIKETLHIDEQLTTTTEMEYSLISPPQLDLGITECKIPSTELNNTIPSPLPLTSAAEPPEVSNSDPLYNFKLSPLNYNGISDEPPQLSQYDYIPISPASRTDEEPDVKQSPRGDCEPRDIRGESALLSDETTTTIETEIPLNSDLPAKLSLPDEPLDSSSIKDSLKFTCIALGLPTQIKCTDPPAGSVQEDLNPPESIEYLNIHADLLRKVEPDDPVIHEASCEQDATLLREDISDGPSTPKPLIICENEMLLLPDPTEKQPTIEAPQFSSAANQLQEETSPKTTQSAQNSAQQGKVPCDICSMCFRSVPGLKRHKAMKHLVRTDKHTVPENASTTTSNHQESVLIYEASQTTEKGHEDDSQNCFPTKIDVMSDILYPETTKNIHTSKAAETNLVQEEMATETNTPVAAEEICQHIPQLPTKAKKNNKAKKNRNTEVNKKPDPFSDELLNILKTDILQAITPEFQNRAMQESCKSPEEQVKTNTHINKNISQPEEFPLPVASNSDTEDISRAPIEKTNPLNQTLEVDQNNADTGEVKSTGLSQMANGAAEVCTDDSVDSGVSVYKDISRDCDESRENLPAVEETCEQKEAGESLATEILQNVAVEIKCEKSNSPADEVDPLSSLNTSLNTPGLSPDLKALIDDDTTFSQLFPRDEEMKRKKCPRVYGKRNKKQKLSPDSQVQDYPRPEICTEKKDQHTENQPDETCVNNQNNHCEYETISIDDAIMLNMCHNGTVKSDTKTVSNIKQVKNDQEDFHENTEELGSNLLSPLESTIDKSSIAWSGSSALDSVAADSAASSDPSPCKEEERTSCPLSGPLTLNSAPNPAEPCVTDNVQPFHSIDIQNINTTFQLPEIQFFDSNKEIAVAPPTATDEVVNTDNEKPKKPTERRGRKRQDGSMKIKDKQYKCKVCFTWFLTLGELNFHKLSHNPSPPPTCYMCVQRKFSSREQLRDHLREKHAKNKAGIWTCGMCLKEISDVWMYNEHLREHATQFARKGQTQGSMLGIPGCFMQETAVKNFITSIMQRRPSKVSRESSKTTKEQDKDKDKATNTDSSMAAVRSIERAEPKVHKSKSSSGTNGKQSTLTPLEVLHKNETPKNLEMHPNCKDPSRDCHHCGKQFPKPFKLQRHLVVHNLEKIFLCHKCPVSYMEAPELKDHLKREHEEVDELDSKHTTLYTCELCADVMHVIKKSFICSTCNYTFSKKEQFDRHMEKHLSGGNKIFKFRGVLRPVKDECDLPASKKRKILTESLQENSSDSGIASIGSLHLNHHSEPQASKSAVSTTDDSTQTGATEYHTDTNNTNVKTEDIAEDYSDVVVELEHCSFHIGSSEIAKTKTEEIDPSPSPKLPGKDGYGKLIPEPYDVKEEDDSLSIREETTSQWSSSKENGKMGEERVKAKQGSAERRTVEAEEKKSEKRDKVPFSEDSFVSYKENHISSKTHDSTKHKSAASMINQLREDEQGQNTTKIYSNENKQKDNLSLNGADQLGSRETSKAYPAKPSDSTKHNSISSPKAVESTPVYSKSSQGSVSSEDRDSHRQQKRRKEMKSPHSLQRVSSPATRENLCVDARAKKKFRPSKCESPSLQRKSDGPIDYPVLSSVRDDVVSNKIVSKHKMGNLGLQSKRSLLDNCTPKKSDIVHHLNGDYKAKKGLPGRPLHSPVSKVSAPPVNNSLNKSRPKMGVRSMESHSYRTAESQNHLLSQLFGQKLTSFKIPLRKDT